MEREYRISVFNKVLIALVGAIFCFMVLSIVIKSGSANSIAFAVFIFSIVGLIGISLFKRRVIITEEAIINITLWDKTIIPRDKIDGIRAQSKIVKVYFNNGDKLNIRYDFLANGFQLLAWLKDNFKDLDQQDRENEYYQITEKKRASTDQVLMQSNYHETLTIELDEQLEFYFKVMIGYNMIAVIGFLFNMVSQNWATISFMSIYPLVGLIVIAKSKGLIRLIFKETSPRHSIFIGVAICVLTNSLTIIKTKNIYLLDNYSLFVIATAIVFIVTAWLVDKGERDEPFDFRRCWIFIIGGLYGYGVITQLQQFLGTF